MRVEAIYQGGFEFQASNGRHQVVMDSKAPLGKDHGQTPKELLLAAILGCSGMDVAGLLKKYHLAPSKFTMSASAEQTDGHPKTFTSVQISYFLEGEGLDSEKIKEAVHLSMTKYCGVSAMVAVSVPINYTIAVNGKEIASGRAEFTEKSD
jgi:putative redox protein